LHYRHAFIVFIICHHNTRLGLPHLRIQEAGQGSTHDT
jgi:hypothetical protein